MPGIIKAPTAKKSKGKSQGVDNLDILDDDAEAGPYRHQVEKIGNAVPPPMGAALGNEIRRSLSVVEARRVVGNSIQTNPHVVY